MVAAIHGMSQLIPHKQPMTFQLSPNAIYKVNSYQTLSSGYEVFASLLIERGAHVNLANKFGDTPLHFAAGNGN